MARRRGKQIQVYVTIGTGEAGLKYGFRTNEEIHNSYGKSELGQTAYQGAKGVFFGANSPKPSRATKDFSGGAVSSYCSTNKIDDLRKANWVVTNKGGIRGIKTAGKTRTVYLEMPGNWHYAWNITSAEADLGATLGFQQATAADASKLIWGVNYPKPPRASIREQGNTTSTFCQPKQSVLEAAIKAGYSISSIDYELLT